MMFVSRSRPSRPETLPAALGLAFALAIGAAAVTLPATARADVVAVEVRSAWSMRSKVLAAALRYDLIWRRSSVFRRDRVRAYIPRAYGLGTAVGDPEWLVEVDLPALSRGDTKARLTVAVKRRTRTARLYADGVREGWEPVEGGSRRVTVNLTRARPIADRRRRAIKADVLRFFAAVRELKTKRPALGSAIERASLWTLDRSERAIDESVVVIAEGRLLGQVVARELEAARRSAQRRVGSPHLR